MMVTKSFSEKNFHKKNAAIISAGSERAAVLVESSVTIFFALMLVVLSFDVITLFRLSTAAYSIAITTARVASVEEPGGFSMTVPADTLIKVPASTPQGYLSAWREHILGTSAPMFTEDVLRALNLGHGWARDLLGNKFKTVTWNAALDAANDLRSSYEFSLVPRHYQFANTTNGNINIDRPADFECCIGVPTLVIPVKRVCRNATSSRYRL